MPASLLLLHLSVFLLALIHRNAWNRNSQKFEAFSGFSRKLAYPETFIVDSSALAMVRVGWAYLLSSSCSFPELLVGFPWAHPSLLPVFLMRVRGRSILRTSH